MDYGFRGYVRFFDRTHLLLVELRGDVVEHVVRDECDHGEEQA